MRISKSVVAASLTLGVCSLTTAARAGTQFNTRNPVTEFHSTGGMNTSGSYAAACMMGAQAWTAAALPTGNWEVPFINGCGTDTTSIPMYASTVWPSQCNPVGMAVATHNYDAAQDWVTSQFSSANQASGVQTVITALMPPFRSAALIPIYGQADHWVAITQITATQVGSTWNINQVKAFDGGPADGVSTDSSGNGYLSGLQSWAGGTFTSVFFKILTAINPICDPVGCTSDPFYGEYLVTWEPPVGLAIPQHDLAFGKAPGIVAPNMMSEQLAQTQVWSALTAADIHNDPEIWSTISGGVPGPAFRVSGTWPSGSAWDYFLVPILSNTNTAIGFVYLAAADGAFEGVHVPSTPVQFNPVTVLQAVRSAHSVLARGELLTGGVLSFDPRSHAHIAKAPINPYYEFGIVSKTNANTGVVRVSLNGGTVVRD